MGNHLPRCQSTQGDLHRSDGVLARVGPTLLFSARLQSLKAPANERPTPPTCRYRQLHGPVMALHVVLREEARGFCREVCIARHSTGPLAGKPEKTGSNYVLRTYGISFVAAGRSLHASDSQPSIQRVTGRHDPLH